MALEVLSGCVVALEADVTVRQRAIQEMHKQLQRQVSDAGARACSGGARRPLRV